MDGQTLKTTADPILGNRSSKTAVMQGRDLKREALSWGMPDPKTGLGGGGVGIRTLGSLEL